MLFFNTTKNQSPKYLFDEISTTRTAYRITNNIGNIPRFNVKHTFFKISFFPSTLIKWNNVGKSISRFECIAFALFKTIQPTPNMTFNCHNLIGIKLITRPRLGLSHLRDYKFKCHFLDCLNPVCCCIKDITQLSIFFELKDLMSLLKTFDLL